MNDVYRLIAWVHMHKKIILFSTFVIFIVAIGVLVAIPARTWRNLFDPARHPLRAITGSTNFEELWVNEDIFVGGRTGSGSKGFLQLDSDSVYSLAVYRNPLVGKRVLRKQQLNDGNVHWEKIFYSPVRAVQMDDHKLFVLTSEQRACGGEWSPQCEVNIVTVYEADSGEEVWTNRCEGLLNVELVETTDSSILIHGSANRSNHRSTCIIDKTSGELVQNTYPHYIGQVPNQYIDPQSVLKNPDFTPISNVFEQDGVFYFVTDQGQLLALHKESGNIIGSVEFTPNDLFVPPGTITVLGEGDTIVVYFEDSRQIFTFHIP